MTSRSKPLVELTVHAADDSTEVFVADGKFRRIADGVGRIEVSVAPGLYAVRFRAGAEQVDRLIEVAGDDPRPQVYGEPVRFEAAAPIEHTATTREFHAGPAQDLSMATPLRRGDGGSGLFIFSRDLDPKSRTRPWTGVEVLDLDGERVAQLKDGETSSDDAFGALHLSVVPGDYRIRVETGDVGTYEMFVHTAEGWQTQIFLLAENFWSEGSKVRRPALKNASVFMRRAGLGFQADDEQIRLTELARQGLVSGREVVRRGELNDMLWMKYENPMIAIFAAHLLLLRPPVNHEMIERVARNLHRLVGDHPDVLALHLRRGVRTPPADIAFPAPPMLRHSWDLVSRATLRRGGLVPAGSATDRVADELIDSAPWLLHRLDKKAAMSASEGPVSVAKGTRLLEDLIDRAGSGEAETMAQMIIDQPERFSSLEQNIASATIGPAYLQHPTAAAGLDDDTPLVSASQVLRNLEAPASSIARSAKSLAEKLGDGLGEEFGELS